jgi:hypothetical protein
MGVKPDGIKKMIENTNLSWIETHQGNWKEQPGMFFQDILVFEKTLS